jgi:putative oxidoreductase
MNTTHSTQSLPLNAQREGRESSDSISSKTVRLLFGTESRVSSLLLRLGLGAVIFPHGAQKALGWFGGYGFEGTMGFFTQTMHIPAFFAFLAILAEFGGALALLTGLFTRVAAFGIGFTLLVAAITVQAQNGFFMNWFGNQKGEGVEYSILVIVIAITLMITGGGKFSLDRAIARKVG